MWFHVSITHTRELACAIATQRYAVVVEQCRRLIIVHQFKNEPQRILLATLSSGLHPTDCFITSTLQKHLFRELKMADTAVKNKESLRWNPPTRRYVSGTTKAGEGDDGAADEIEDADPAEPLTHSASLPGTPTKNNPLLVAIYGQLCITAKSYQSAICELCDHFWPPYFV
jgi:general transcription factor 3C polypeptide 3 (transcription factor C subunit 4)